MKDRWACDCFFHYRPSLKGLSRNGAWTVSSAKPRLMPKDQHMNVKDTSPSLSYKVRCLGCCRNIQWSRFTCQANATVRALCHSIGSTQVLVSALHGYYGESMPAYPLFGPVSISTLEFLGLISSTPLALADLTWLVTVLSLVQGE